jgi:heme/copper-type cytochrome/quinol oxidase subunit 4
MNTNQHGIANVLLQRLDFGLVLLILGFIGAVVADTVSRVPTVWPYLILHDLHDHLARFGLVLALVMTIVAVYIGMIRKQDVTPLFRRAAYIISGTMLVEALIGLSMFTLFNARPGQDAHLIYGMGTVLFLPFFIFVESTAKKRPAMGSYIWGFALLTGIILRATMTGAS